MNGYYEILGVSREASEAEIKKAYFKLIRKYSPESDPEMFQKIRQAYEQLKDGDKEKRLQSGDFTYSDPFGEKMMKQANQYFHMGMYEAARDTYEAAWKKYPKDIQFLYYLVILQRKCGNTGKAVKNAQELVKADPNNGLYWKELAFSCFDRGFTKKANSACEKAYELGCRETEFILMSTDVCLYREEFERGWELLIELLQREKKWKKEEMTDLFEALFRMVYLVQYSNEEKHILDSLELCEALLKKYRIYVNPYVMNIYSILSVLLTRGKQEKSVEEKVRLNMQFLEEICTDQAQKELLKEFKGNLRLHIIEQDKRLPEILQWGCKGFLGEDDGSYLQRYIQLDAKLCMIEEREEVLAKMELLWQEYPEYYEKLKEFLDRLKNEKGLSHLKETLKKDYDRLSNYCEG